jgi:hypothetical protein|tara:strand:- start:1727 stop:2095 length:369 start_codon:yes stop_codon:yes gene_type:complete
VLIYVASPYSSKETNIVNNLLERTARVNSVCKYIASKYKYGLNRDTMYFSPIVHFHNISQHYEHSLPTDAHFWESVNKIMINLADKVEVLMLSEWKESIGIKMEIQYCKEINKPVFFVEPIS